MPLPLPPSSLYLANVVVVVVIHVVMVATVLVLPFWLWLSFRVCSRDWTVASISICSNFCPRLSCPNQRERPREHVIHVSLHRVYSMYQYKYVSTAYGRVHVVECVIVFVSAGVEVAAVIKVERGMFRV